MAYEGEIITDDLVPPTAFVEDLNPEWQNEHARTIDYNADNVDELIEDYWKEADNG